MTDALLWYIAILLTLLAIGAAIGAAIVVRVVFTVPSERNEFLRSQREQAKAVDRHTKEVGC